MKQRFAAVSLIIITLFVCWAGPSWASIWEIARYSQANDGTSRAFVASGDLLYAQRGFNFEIYDVSDPGSPELRGQMFVGSSIADLEIIGSVLYIAEEAGVLRVVNVSDPTAPYEITRFEHDEQLTEMDINSSTLYLLSRNMLRSYDVTTPAAPAFLDTVSFYGGGGVDIAVNNDVAYVAPRDVNSSFHMIDVSDPENMDYYDYVEPYGGLGVMQVEMAGDTLIVGGGWLAYLGEIEIYDCSSDSLAPDYLDTISAGNIRIESLDALRGPQAAIVFFAPYSDLDGSAASYDLYSDTITPIDDSASYGDSSPYYPLKMICAGDHLFVGTSRGGYEIYDLFSSLTDPPKVFTSDGGGVTYAAEIANGKVYLAQATSFTVFDLTYFTNGTDSLVTELCRVRSDDVLSDVSIDGNKAYCAGSSYTSVFDISCPKNVVETTSIIWSCDKLAVKHNIMCALSTSSTIIPILNVSDPEYPVILGLAGIDPSSSFTGERSDFVLHADYLYVGDKTNGVLVYDSVSSVEGTIYPVEYEVSGGVEALALLGDELVVGTSGGDIVVISVADPTDLTTLGSVNIPGAVRSITRTHNMVYAANWYNKLYEINITDRESPAVVDSIPLYQGSTGLAVCGKWVVNTGEVQSLQAWKTPESTTWKNLGPGGGGAIICARFHPDDSDVIFAGSDVAGIFRSLDGGLSWETINDSLQTYDGRGICNVNDFAFQGSNTVYALTTGIFRSEDSGDTFSRLHTGDIKRSVNCLLIDEDNYHQWAGPGKSQGCIADAQSVIYVTDDCWDSFSAESLKTITGKLDTVVVYSIVQLESDTLLASTTGGLYRRIPNDPNNEWHQQEFELEETDFTGWKLREMVIDDTSQPPTLYMVIGSCDNCEIDSEWYGGVYKSTNNGYDWTCLNGDETEGPNIIYNGDFEVNPDANPWGWEGWHYSDFSPPDSAKITEGAYGTGHALTVTTPPDDEIEERWMAIHTDGYELEEGSEVVILRFDASVDISQDLTDDDLKVYLRWFLPDTEDIENHTCRVFRDGYTPWPQAWSSYITYAPVVNADSVWIIFATKSHELEYSIDNVELCVTSALPKIAFVNGQFVQYNGLAFDPVAGTLYTGTVRETSEYLNGIWRKSNSSNEWERLSRMENTFERPTGVWHHNHTWYVELSQDDTPPKMLFGDGEIYCSSDNGVSWHNITADSLGVSHWKSRGDIQPVFVNTFIDDPANPNRLYYGDGDNRLLYSDDDGETWHRLGRDYYTLDPSTGWDGKNYVDCATSIVVDPVDPDIVYCGIFNHEHFAPNDWADNWEKQKEDGGVVKGYYDDATGMYECSQIADSLPKGGPIRLLIDYDEETRYRTIYAAVFTKGIYRYTEPDTEWVTLIDTLDITDDLYTADSLSATRMYPTQMILDDMDRLFVAFGDRIGLTALIETDPKAYDHGVWMLEPEDTIFKKIDTLYGQPVLTMALSPAGSLLVSTGSISDVGTVELVDGCLAQDDYKDKPGGMFVLWDTGNYKWGADKRLAQTAIYSIVPGDACNPQRIFVASSNSWGGHAWQVAGILGTEDYGNTWCLWPQNGLQNFRALRLNRSQTKPGLFYAYTHGSGLFRGTLPPPLAPTGLEVDGYDDDFIKLTWTPPLVVGFGHEVLRREMGQTEWNSIASLGHVDSYTDYDVVCGENYDYAVRAFNESGESAMLNVINAGPIGVYSIDPTLGPTVGNEAVTITGCGFMSGATVKFGGAPATSVNVVNSYTITCRTPIHAPGYVDVRIDNPNGIYAILTNGFRYVTGGKLKPRE